MVDTWLTNLKEPTQFMAVKQDDAPLPAPQDNKPESAPSQLAQRPSAPSAPNGTAEEPPSTSYDGAPDSITLLRKFSVHPTSSRRLQGMLDASLMILALLPTAIFRLIRAAMGLVGVTEHRWRGISMVVPLTLEDQRHLESLVQNLVAATLGRRPEAPKRGPVSPSQQLLLDVHAILAAATSTAATYGLPYEGLAEAALHAKLASYLRGIAASESVCTQDCFKVMRKMGRTTLRSLCAAAPRLPTPCPPSPPPLAASAATAAGRGPARAVGAARSLFGSVLHTSPSSTSFMSRPRPRAVAKAFNAACLLQQCASHPETLIQLLARLPDGSGDLVETMSLISLAPGVEYLRLLSGAAAAEDGGAGVGAAELFAEQLEAMTQYDRLRPSDAKTDPGVQGLAINARIHEVGIVRYGKHQGGAVQAAPLGTVGAGVGADGGVLVRRAGAVAESNDGPVFGKASRGTSSKGGSSKGGASRTWTLVQGFQEDEESEDAGPVAGRQSMEGSEAGSEPDDTVGLLQRVRRQNGRTSSASELPAVEAPETPAAFPATAAPTATAVDPAIPPDYHPLSSAAAGADDDGDDGRGSPRVTSPLMIGGPTSSRALAPAALTASPAGAAAAAAAAPSPTKPSAGTSFFTRPLPPGFIAGSAPSTSFLHYPTAALDVFRSLYACPRSGAFAVHGREPRGVGLSRLVTAYSSVHAMPAASQAALLAGLGFRSVDDLRREVELRRALCVAQALPVIVASLRLMVRSPACLLAAHRTGSFLHVQQSLLSDLHRHERGYLEDTKGALDALGEKLAVRFVEGSEKVLPLHLSGGGTITVSLPVNCVSSEALAAAGLSRQAFCSGRYGLTALLLNQGINSLQSLGFLAWRGPEALQDTLNRHSLERLNEYALRANRASGPALAALNRHYGPEGRRPPKDTAMFALVRHACAEVGGGRAVNCKSGKDRTALEVSKAMAEEVVAAGVLPPAATAWLEAQFLRGLSYVTTSQNHGQPPAYAFNEMEIATLPAGWRPDWRLCGKVAT